MKPAGFVLALAGLGFCGCSQGEKLDPGLRLKLIRFSAAKPMQRKWLARTFWLKEIARKAGQGLAGRGLKNESASWEVFRAGEDNRKNNGGTPRL